MLCYEDKPKGSNSEICNLGLPLFLIFHTPEKQTDEIGIEHRAWGSVCQTEFAQLLLFSLLLYIDMELPIKLTLVQAMELVNDVGAPNIGVHLDTYHMNIEENNFENAIALCGDKLQ